jgi:hypothetical protein
MAVIETAAIVAATTYVTATTEFISAVTAFFTSIGVFIASVVAAVGAVVGACAYLAKHFPPPEKGSEAEKIYNLVNKIGQNTGYAANKAETE